MEKRDLRNVGYVQDTVDVELMEKIKNTVSEIKENLIQQKSFAGNLVGNIRKQFVFDHHRDEIEQLAIKLAQYHDDEYDCSNYLDDSFGKLTLGALWVNLQVAGEFNPIHKHPGVYSFVIWVELPFTHENEKIYGPGFSSNSNKAGSFEFVYTNTYGQLMSHNIPADESFQGKIILFPAKLNHTVYPFFTSDGYRISISGNLFRSTK
jgi:hypothetical protein